MSENLLGILPSLTGLGIAALVALLLTLTRAAGDPDRNKASSVMRLVLFAIVIQSAHFTEELLQGFHERFPELLGLPAWPVAFFVSFNLFWIATWLLCLAGLRARLRVALFPVWFLAICSTMNGVFHPLFALAEGRYFPGLWTSPVSGIVGLWLLRRLTRFTRPQEYP